MVQWVKGLGGDNRWHRKHKNYFPEIVCFDYVLYTQH